MEAHTIAQLLTALCCLFVVLTLVGEKLDVRALIILGKPCASASFVGLALHLAQWEVSPRGYPLLIVVGLVFGAAGDVALMSKAKTWFLVGLVSFLIGHVAYLLAFARLGTAEDWLTPWSLLPIVAALVVLKYLWKHLGSMRVPVLAYMVAIVLMVIAAIAVAIGRAPLLETEAIRFLLIGALLFFASDVAVAKARFVEARFVDRLWGLPCYYAGQLCIVWSLS
ncbi:MAG: lysoplasmalogenase [Myxococcales bacterium]|nr:lysoplasmalogenase [Myxococcales bacterium]